MPICMGEGHHLGERRQVPKSGCQSKGEEDRLCPHYLKDCGLSGVVSVSLLNRHFQISSDELLVEVQAVGQSDISVYNRSSEIAMNAVPYMFFQVVFDNRLQRN